MNLTIERAIPWLVGVVSAYAWHKQGILLPLDEKEFLAAALSMGAVLTGFIATAQAILMALPSDSVMRQIRSSGYLPILASYIHAALAGGLLFCIINVAGFFLIQPNVRLHQYFSATWAGVGCFALLAFYRVTTILMKIMRH